MTDFLSNRDSDYNDIYPTCYECRCVLMIYSETYPIKDIAKKLNLKPSLMRQKGDIVKTRFGERISQYSFWQLNSDGHVGSKDFSRHLTWLIREIYDASEILLELQKINGIDMSIRCTWVSRYGHGGPTIWPEHMKYFSQLNLELTFDLYF